MMTEKDLEEELNRIFEDEVPLKSQARFLEMCGYENLDQEKGYMRITEEMSEIIKLYNRCADHVNSAIKSRHDNYKEGIRELQYLSTIMLEIAKIAPNPRTAWEISFQSLMVADRWAVKNNDFRLRNEIYAQYRTSVKKANR